MNQQLIFRQSNIAIYQIIETPDGRRYVMDTSKVSPKTYGWGGSPSHIEAEMVELEADNQSFNLGSKSKKMLAYWF